MVGVLLKGTPARGLGEQLVASANLQGWGPDTREGLARWVAANGIDRVLGSEHQKAVWEGDHFAGLAVRASCLPVEQGGGKLSAAVDLRAVELLAATAQTELAQLPVSAGAADGTAGSQERRCEAMAWAYIERRRELLGCVAEWCEAASAGREKDGVWWWRSGS